MTGEQTIPCNQCGKPAIVKLNGHPMCVDCNYKWKQAQWMEFAQAATMANHADRELTSMVGMPHLSNQIKIPSAPIPPIHYNNQTVTVTGGTVGAINFGNVHDIQVNLEAMTQNGEIGIADAMANLTNAVLNNAEVNDKEKNEILEHLAYLSSQAILPNAERKPGIIKSVAAAVKGGVEAIPALAEAWKVAEPILHGYFPSI